MEVVEARGQDGAHRFWRVLVLSSSWTGWEAYIRVADLYARGASAPLRGGAALCKPPSAPRANSNPAFAFDGDESTMWRTEGNAGECADWIGYDADEAVDITRLRLVQWGEDCNAITQLALEWSDDGVAWTPRFVSGRVPCTKYDSDDDEDKLTGSRAIAAAAASFAHQADLLPRFKALSTKVPGAGADGGGGDGAHRFWRVLVLSSSWTGWEAYIRVADLYARGASAPLRGGAALCKPPSAPRANSNPAFAFDGDESTMWRTEGNAGACADWIGYDADEAVDITRLRLVQWGEDCNAITQLALEWSDDGVAWTPRFVSGRVPCTKYDSDDDEDKLTGSRATAAAAASVAHAHDLGRSAFASVSDAERVPGRDGAVGVSTGAEHGGVGAASASADMDDELSDDERAEPESLTLDSAIGVAGLVDGGASAAETRDAGHELEDAVLGVALAGAKAHLEGLFAAEQDPAAPRERCLLAKRLMSDLVDNGHLGESQVPALLASLGWAPESVVMEEDWLALLRSHLLSLRNTGGASQYHTSGALGGQAGAKVGGKASGSGSVETRGTTTGGENPRSRYEYTNVDLSSWPEDCVSFDVLPIESGEWHCFLSHYQLNAGDQALWLREMLWSQTRGAMRVWYDMDESGTEDGMRCGVTKSVVFVLILSAGVLKRPFCQLEVSVALQQNKQIVLLHETSRTHGGEAVERVLEEGVAFSTDLANINAGRVHLTEAQIRSLRDYPCLPFLRGVNTRSAVLLPLLKLLGAIPSHESRAVLHTHKLRKPVLTDGHRRHLLIVHASEAAHQALFLREALQTRCKKLRVAISADFIGRAAASAARRSRRICLILTAHAWRDSAVVEAVAAAQAAGTPVHLLHEQACARTLVRLHAC